jgi:hypothetical protein
MNTHDAARRYVELGFSVIPVRADGSKAPLESGWREFSDRQPRTEELKHWFGNGSVCGIGIPCGPASGNLAVLDFETGDVWERWRALLSSETVDFIDRCPIVRTPSGGVHVWCRSSQRTAGTVLARDKDKGVLIEIRGDGHQVLAPGCPASCHKTGRLYEFIQKPTETQRQVPLNVFAEWCDLAATLNEYVRPPEATRTPPPSERLANDKEPGTDFNYRGTWEETGLFETGWVWVRQYDSERGTVRRPGKCEGISGTIGMVTSREHSWPLFFCFTSNGQPFELQRGYDRFGTYARVNHAGDLVAAARALAERGYGEQTRRSPSRPKGDPKHPKNGSPTAPSAGSGTASGTPPACLVSRALSEIETSDVRWLWPGGVPFGMLTMLDGDPAHGKSLITLDLAARLSRGTAFPLCDTQRLEPAGVLIIAAEDSAEQTIKPRCVVAGCNEKLIRISETIRLGKDERPIRFPDDFELLEQEIQTHSIKLLIVDPLLGFISQAIDTHKDQHVRDVLHKLKLVAERTGIAVIGLRHLSKGSAGGNILYRGMGSIAITASARSALTVANHPTDAGLRVMAMTKCNLVKPPRSITYRITDLAGPAVITWGEECNITANDLTGKPIGGKRCEAVTKAVEFLQDVLQSGPMRSTEVVALATHSGISARTLDRAKAALGVRSQKNGYTSSWEMALPAEEHQTLEERHSIPE